MATPRKYGFTKCLSHNYLCKPQKSRVNAFRKRLDGQLLKVVVGIARISVDTFLQLEDPDGEDTGKMMLANTRKGRFKQPSCNQSSFGRGISAIVD